MLMICTCGNHLAGRIKLYFPIPLQIRIALSALVSSRKYYLARYFLDIDYMWEREEFRFLLNSAQEERLKSFRDLLRRLIRIHSNLMAGLSH